MPDPIIEKIKLKNSAGEQVYPEVDPSDKGTEVVANPTLAGTESDLTGIQVGETKYKVAAGGSGEQKVKYITLNYDSATSTWSLPTGVTFQSISEDVNVNGYLDILVMNSTPSFTKHFYPDFISYTEASSAGIHIFARSYDGFNTDVPTSKRIFSERIEITYDDSTQETTLTYYNQEAQFSKIYANPENPGSTKLTAISIDGSKYVLDGAVSAVNDKTGNVKLYKNDIDAQVDTEELTIGYLQFLTPRSLPTDNRSAVTGSWTYTTSTYLGPDYPLVKNISNGIQLDNLIKQDGIVYIKTPETSYRGRISFGQKLYHNVNTREFYISLDTTLWSDGMSTFKCLRVHYALDTTSDIEVITYNFGPLISDESVRFNSRGTLEIGNKAIYPDNTNETGDYRIFNNASMYISSIDSDYYNKYIIKSIYDTLPSDSSKSTLKFNFDNFINDIQRDRPDNNTGIFYTHSFYRDLCYCLMNYSCGEFLQFSNDMESLPIGKEFTIFKADGGLSIIAHYQKSDPGSGSGSGSGSETASIVFYLELSSEYSNYKYEICGISADDSYSGSPLTSILHMQSTEEISDGEDFIMQWYNNLDSNSIKSYMRLPGYNDVDVESETDAMFTQINTMRFLNALRTLNGYPLCYFNF